MNSRPLPDRIRAIVFVFSSLLRWQYGGRRGTCETAAAARAPPSTAQRLCGRRRDVSEVGDMGDHGGCGGPAVDGPVSCTVDGRDVWGLPSTAQRLHGRRQGRVGAAVDGPASARSTAGACGGSRRRLLDPDS